MANAILKQESALGAYHTGLAHEQHAAVIFNDKASAAGLMSYAHGQLVMIDAILDTLATVVDRSNEIGEFAGSIRSMLTPASKALELAVRRTVMDSAPKAAGGNHG